MTSPLHHPHTHKERRNHRAGAVRVRATAGQFRLLLRKFDIDVARDEDFERLVAAIDPDRSGEINYEELLGAFGAEPTAAPGESQGDRFCRARMARLERKNAALEADVKRLAVGKAYQRKTPGRVEMRGRS